MICLEHTPPPANYLKGKQRKGSTPLKESHNNHFKLKARAFFLRIVFSRKIAVYITGFCQRQSQENFAKFLVTLQAEGEE